MADAPPKKDDAPAGAPAWMATFADLMSLLLCFFVLLLSFADMEVKKFKDVSASLKQALGVSTAFKDDSLPKGISIIKREFRPGKQDLIEFENIDHRYEPRPSQRERKEKDDENESTVNSAESASAEAESQLEKAVEELQESAAKEIAKGELEVEKDGMNLIVRIPEKGSFSSGSAKIRKRFGKTLYKVAKTVKKLPGQIMIQGHTDSVPISTKRFRSNWDLSAARAASVTHTLIKIGKMNPVRFTIQGHADTRPAVNNNTPANRAKNRRVEIVVQSSSPTPTNMQAPIRTRLPAQEGTAPHKMIDPETGLKRPYVPSAPYDGLIEEDIEIETSHGSFSNTL